MESGINPNDIFKDVNWAGVLNSVVKLNQAMTDWATAYFKAIEKIIKPLHTVAELIPNRFVNEHPVDYVLRRGAATGHYIYTDEAWRFRANLDWWEGDEVDDQWGKRWKAV